MPSTVRRNWHVMRVPPMRAQTRYAVSITASVAIPGAEVRCPAHLVLRPRDMRILTVSYPDGDGSACQRAVVFFPEVVAGAIGRTGMGFPVGRISNPSRFGDGRIGN